MQNREGQTVPSVVFPTVTDKGFSALKSEEIFAGKKVVLFALPGAFTPTCSSAHVPRYNELAPLFAKQGVDEIVCLSVNDSFVMNAWQADQHADRVRFVADGNGEFSEGMGMLVGKENLGFGKRSWRYSMFVDDGVIKKMFIEEERDGDPFDVSDADTMLNYLSDGQSKAHDVIMFSKDGCSHCARAKKLLAQEGIPFVELPGTPRNLRAASGKATTPQIFMNGALIGGADELTTFIKEGRHQA